MSVDERQVPSPSAARAPGARVAALALLIVAACFSAVIAGTLAVEVLRPAVDPYDPSSELPAMRGRLVESNNPTSERAVKIAGEIRQYDVELRANFFRRRLSYDSGRWLLAAGLVVTVLAAHGYVSLGRRLNLPPLSSGIQKPEWTAVARRNVAGLAVAGGAVCAALLVAALVGHVSLAAPEVEPITLTGQWPAFRGPQMTGVVPPGTWPDRWSARTGENILWKCPIPGQGNSSPVVWGDRIFVTSADTTERWVHCASAATGRLAWSRRVESPPGGPEMTTDDVMDLTGFAAPTAVTDGQAVWATFANADVVCFDFSGNQKWVINLGKPVSTYGLATSLLLHKNVVILQHDQGSNPEDGLSWLIAMDKATGEIVRRVPRETANSWSTPILIGPAEGLPRQELITCSSPYVMAYDPDTFEELWRAKGLDGDVAPTPTFAGGLVFMANADGQAMAIRPGGSGDVTATHVVWSADEALPDTVSPLASATHYMHVASYGEVVCYRAADGTKLWQNRFESTFRPSPSLVGNLVYLPDDFGTTYIFELADEFKLIRSCDLGESQSASPAFADGRIYIRAKSNLYCIGPKPESGK